MVLSEEAMKNLKAQGKAVYINVPLDEIKRRVTNIKTRGIAFHKGETLDDVFRLRVPLYEKYADITVDFTDCSNGGIEDTINLMVEKINKI